MTFRYSLVSLDASMDAIELLEEEIFQHHFATAHALGGEELQRPWIEVVAHLKVLGAKTLLIQRKVIDTDYLEEHQAFYAKQHRPVSIQSCRIHAFKCEKQEDDGGREDRYIVQFLDGVATEDYLGYINTRPLRHAPVGSTVLAALPGKQPTVSDDFPARIAGNEFVVHGTPFLQQDNAVGACAQASMWMALRALRRRQGNAAYSPAELTIAATRYLMVDRPFPGRKGLTIPQILDTIRFAGHDPLHLHLRNLDDPQWSKSSVLAEIAPYIDSGLPALIVLAPADSEGHVVLGIGLRKKDVSDHSLNHEHEHEDGEVKIYYQPTSNWLSGLLIHNDAAGPYQELLPADDTQDDYKLEDAVSVVVPLPDGIYTTAAEAELLAIRSMWRACAIARHVSQLPPALPEAKLALRTVLCTRHAFRRWAKEDPNLDPMVKDVYRTHELPPYVWVVEIHDADKFNPSDPNALSRCGEVVLDASADRFHADSHIFTSILSALWPTDGDQMDPGITLREFESNELSAQLIDVGRLGGKIERPWVE